MPGGKEADVVGRKFRAASRKASEDHQGAQRAQVSRSEPKASEDQKVGERRRAPARERQDVPQARRRARWPWRPIAWTVLGLGFAVGFVAAAFLVSLDHQVRERFEGTQFRVPSRVYSAPAILYPGLDWRRFGLQEALARLGYREAASSRDLPPGQYVWEGSRLRVHLRAFEHPTRPEPDARHRDLAARRAISDIREIPGGDSVGAVLLEPEPLGAYYGPVREQRELVRLADLPQHLVDAVLAVEDQRFDDPLGDRLPPHRGRDAREPARGPRHAGRQHAHAAAREELLPDARAHAGAASCAKRAWR